VLRRGFKLFTGRDNLPILVHRTSKAGGNAIFNGKYVCGALPDRLSECDRAKKMKE